jgi:hypothetical protein
MRYITGFKEIELIKNYFVFSFAHHSLIWMILTNYINKSVDWYKKGQYLILCNWDYWANLILVKHKMSLIIYIKKKLYIILFNIIIIHNLI